MSILISKHDVIIDLLQKLYEQWLGRWYRSQYLVYRRSKIRALQGF